MNRFWMRRITYGAVAAFALFCLLRVLSVQDNRLQASTHTSGYWLAGAVAFLAAFNLRKKLAFIPLGSASAWLQLHIYVGLAAWIVFLVHTGMRWPNGSFETVLYSTFTLTSASGAIGLILTRRIPRQLTKLREQVIYERIPAFRLRVQKTAHSVVQQLVTRAGSEAIADFYLNRLVFYFGMPRSWSYYAHPTSKLRNQLQLELHNLSRFLSVDERQVQSRLQQLIDQRDDLDYQHAQQRRLKLWLFGHIALTIVLCCLTVLHVTMALAFTGRAV